MHFCYKNKFLHAIYSRHQIQKLQVTARDGDTGFWGKLCYSLSGEGTSHPATRLPCSLPRLKPSSQWAGNGGATIRKSGAQHEKSAAIDRGAALGANITQPEFEIDSVSGVISVTKVKIIMQNKLMSNYSMTKNDNHIKYLILFVENKHMPFFIIWKNCAIFSCFLW